jgi:hypothetical protein
MKMATVAEFIEIRQRIESLIAQIGASAGKPIPESIQRFDQANRLLETLKTMADNDVQEICVGRLTRVLATLGKKAVSPPGRKRVAKKSQPVG